MSAVVITNHDSEATERLAFHREMETEDSRLPVLAAIKAESAAIKRAAYIAEMRRGYQTFDSSVSIGELDFDVIVYWEAVGDNDVAQLAFVELKRECSRCPIDMPEGIFIDVYAVCDENDLQVQADAELDELRRYDPLAIERTEEV